MIIRSLNQFNEITRSIGARALFWKLSTNLSKHWIYCTDQRRLYSYPNWLMRKENSWRDSKERDRSPRGVNALSLRVVILYQDGQHGPCIEKTVHSLTSQTDSILKLDVGNIELERPLPEFLTGLQKINVVSATGFMIDTANGGDVLRPMQSENSEWIVFLMAGDQVTQGFAQSIRAAIRSDTPQIIYWDEDRLDARGAPCDPWFKPDWSPELLLSVNFLDRVLIRRELLDKVLSNTNQESIQNYEDLIYRCADMAESIQHIPQILLHTQELVRSHPSIEVLQRRVDRKMQGEEATVGLSNIHEVHIEWPKSKSLASIIIPTRDNLEYLRKCITSLTSLTQHSNYEIILMDTGSQECQTWKYYEELRENPKIRIEHEPGIFNYSRVNNHGAKIAQGQVLIFLNNDIEVIDKEWLLELVGWASQPAIGVVGAKLLYPDHTIQHAGVIMGMEGHASHVFSHAPDGYSGLFGSVDWYRDYSAVTGACMAIRREVYDLLGGFDESYRIAFGDVDICLRAREQGFRVLYNPYVRLIHHEGKSRANYIPAEDIRYASDKMKIYVQRGDEYYNPNLSLSVRIPTLKRFFEEDPLHRLEMITRWS